MATVKITQAMSGTAGLEEIANQQEAGVLEMLGGVLTKGKEKLRVAGQTVKENSDLILLAGAYLLEVGAVASMVFDMAQNPQHAINTFGTPIKMENARLAAYAMVGAFQVFLVPSYYLRFTARRSLFEI